MTGFVSLGLTAVLVALAWFAPNGIGRGDSRKVDDIPATMRAAYRAGVAVGLMLAIVVAIVFEVAFAVVALV